MGWSKEAEDISDYLIYTVLFNSSITLLTGVFDFAMAAIVPSFPLVTKNCGLIFKEYCLPFKYAVNLSVPYFILLFSSR